MPHWSPPAGAVGTLPQRSLLQAVRSTPRHLPDRRPRLDPSGPTRHLAAKQTPDKTRAKQWKDGTRSEGSTLSASGLPNGGPGVLDTQEPGEQSDHGGTGAIPTRRLVSDHHRRPMTGEESHKGNGSIEVDAPAAHQGDTGSARAQLIQCRTGLGQIGQGASRPGPDVAHQFDDQSRSN